MTAIVVVMALSRLNNAHLSVDDGHMTRFQRLVFWLTLIPVVILTIIIAGLEGDLLRAIAIDLMWFGTMWVWLANRPDVGRPQ